MLKLEEAKKLYKREYDSVSSFADVGFNDLYFLSGYSKALCDSLSQNFDVIDSFIEFTEDLHNKLSDKVLKNALSLSDPDLFFESAAK